MIDASFSAVFNQLMKTDFLASTKSKLGADPTPPKAGKLVSEGQPFIPIPFRAGYVDPLEKNMAGLFARLTSSQGLDVDTLETMTGAVFQHDDAALRPKLHRFLAVISNMYRSFLDKSKREHLSIPFRETLPPLAVFQSDPSGGPFTITCDTVGMLIGGNIGVVSLPNPFADHPLLYGSLAHETGGHDVIHADTKLMPQLRHQVYSLFGDSEKQLAVLWDYWMDEAAADVYGVLNMGPSFGANLALLLAVFIGQAEKSASKTPLLRTESGAQRDGSLDPHPTDLVRLALAQGVVSALSQLSPSTRDTYDSHLARLAQSLGNGATQVALSGFVRVRNGHAVNFEQQIPLVQMQEAARKVGAMIATSKFAALDGRSVQDIETWDDADENAAVAIAGRLATGSSIVGLGDDAQILAGLTLAALQNPARYQAASVMVVDALNDSFATDPFWSVSPRDRFVVMPSRSCRTPEVSVDPYVEKIIDYNPLEEDTAGLPPGLAAATLERHQIAPIPWPKGEAPEPDPSFTFKSRDAELPKADIVMIPWTSAEANAMSAVMTPGIWAMPPSHYKGESWHEYANQWNAKFAGRSSGRAPAATQHYIGKFMPILLKGRKVLLFKSNFHLARDDKSMPVKDMFKQVIQQTGARLVITTGTAGAIGSKLQLGDAVIATSARFHCGRNFKNAPFNGKTYDGGYDPVLGNLLKTVNDKLVEVNAGQLKPARPKGTPQVFTTKAQAGAPPVIITTDEFEFDDKSDKFGLQGLGAMVEMDDAVLGLAVQEMGTSTKWLAIRNASDPQMPGTSKKDKDDASNIYEKYGYWTTIPSTLACWAVAVGL